MDPANTSRDRPLFDRYARRYHSVLNCSLAPAGEGARYFARMRIHWLQEQLQKIDFAPSTVLDYGCGTGGSVPFLREILHPARILGVDISSESLSQARKEHGGEGVEFANSDHHPSRSGFQLAFCSGVFHHIFPAQRPAALRYIYDSLVPAGLFAFWENNPFNPATRYIMGRCEFDADAIPISPGEARKLLCSNGFRVLHSSSHFYFPGWLRCLRGMEPTLARLPLGAQYLLLARKTGQ